jgi:uncharacterized protein (DUF885 family)
MTIRGVWLRSAVTMAAMATLGCSGGGGNTAPQGPAAGSGDAAFKQVATEILEDLFKRRPTQATDLGIHKYDAELDDYSAAAVKAESDAARAFKTRLAAIDPASLSLDQQLDREQLLRAADNTVVQNDVIKRWAKDPDLYPTGITNRPT